MKAKERRVSEAAMKRRFRAFKSAVELEVARLLKEVPHIYTWDLSEGERQTIKKMLSPAAWRRLETAVTFVENELSDLARISKIARESHDDLAAAAHKALAAAESDLLAGLHAVQFTCQTPEELAAVRKLDRVISESVLTPLVKFGFDAKRVMGMVPKA